MLGNRSIPQNESDYVANQDNDEGECDGLNGCFEDIPVPGEAYYIFYALSAILIGVGNLLVIIAVFRNKKLRSSATNILIVSLAFSDLFIGLLYCPYVVVDLVVGGVQMKETYLCRGFVVITRTCLTATTFALVAIAIDRYRAIVQPMQRRISVQQAKVMSIIVWVMAFLYNSEVFVTYKIVFESWQEDGQNFSYYVCDIQYELVYIESRYMIANMIVIYLLPLLLLIFLYAKMIHVLYSGSSINDESRRRKRKAVKMLILVVILYALSWGPFRVHAVLYAYDESWFTDSNFIYTIISFAFTANSFVNPMIYAYCNKNFRDEFVFILSCGIKSPAKKAASNTSKVTKNTYMSESISTKPLADSETGSGADRNGTVYENQALEMDSIDNVVRNIENVSNNEQRTNGGNNDVTTRLPSLQMSDDNAQPVSVSQGTQTILG
ncbi:QRFP-like peptide receptor [Saccoglossus kowalevskii]|uniref:Neuropeptide FF receptor 1-like n=1 Tax=Saccoglossus kowalevskii TaxID=10224 RepID=A0ABM0GWI9_SACKO|nr:PREDICTED: neuropeptide FF receptor 1-like [Saccoglossus kowalevskii]